MTRKNQDILALRSVHVARDPLQRELGEARPASQADRVFGFTNRYCIAVYQTDSLLTLMPEQPEEGSPGLEGGGEVESGDMPDAAARVVQCHDGAVISWELLRDSYCQQ